MVKNIWYHLYMSTHRISIKLRVQKNFFFLTSNSRVSADPFINFPTNKILLSYKSQRKKKYFYTQILDIISHQDKDKLIDILQ